MLDVSNLHSLRSFGHIYTKLIESLIKEGSLECKRNYLNELVSNSDPNVREIFLTMFDEFTKCITKNKKLLDQHRGKEKEYIINTIYSIKNKNPHKKIKREFLRNLDKIEYKEPTQGLPFLYIPDELYEKIPKFGKTSVALAWYGRSFLSFILVNNEYSQEETLLHETHHIFYNLAESKNPHNKKRYEKRIFESLKDEAIAYSLDKTLMSDYEHSAIVAKRRLSRKTRHTIKSFPYLRDLFHLVPQINSTIIPLVLKKQPWNDFIKDIVTVLRQVDTNTWIEVLTRNETNGIELLKRLTNDAKIRITAKEVSEKGYKILKENTRPGTASFRNKVRSLNKIILFLGGNEIPIETT